MFFADYGNAFTGYSWEVSDLTAVDESICNGLLQAAERLHHGRTDIEDGVFGLGVSMEPAATPACESSRMAKAVWSIYRASASAHMPLTEAAWQAVWNWQATPGNGTQQPAMTALLCLLLARS